MESFWKRELTKFHSFTDGESGATYRDWQPAKWQSLTRIADDLVEHHLPEGATALELGCGSATLLLQLAERGVSTVGVDRDVVALQLARESASSIGLTSGFEFIEADFNEPSDLAGIKPADLVMHIGVIEHFTVEQQLEFLRLTAEHSHRWALVGIPNLDSPVFRSFLTTVTRDDAVYEDEHLDIDVPALAEELHFRVESFDGCHVFLGQQDLYNSGDDELDDFYDRMRAELVAVGGERFKEFPRMDFTSADISTMRIVESSCSIADRRRFGFLNYYLIDCR